MNKESEITVALKAAAIVLDTSRVQDMSLDLIAHTIRRGANQMVKLEATVIAQSKRLALYRHTIALLNRLGATG